MLVLRGEFREEDHPRAEDGKFGSGGGGGGTGGESKDASDASAGQKPAKNPAKNPAKAKASRGEMTGARREGSGKDARVVLEDGTPAPAHITPAMIGADWKEVKVSKSPDSDVLATGRDGKGRAKTVYSDAFHMRQAAAKFARTREGLVEGRKMHGQMMDDRKDQGKAAEADCAWLMSVQATRPGSESDNKGNSRLFGEPLAPADVKVDGDSVTLTVKGQEVPIRDKKAKAEIKRRLEHGEPLHDSTFWLKSHGATTLEGRHVQERDGKVFLEFMGKESVWHSHEVKDHALAAMLVERKGKAGDGGSLFGTSYEKVSKYTKTLDGGKFTPKDFRTQRATSLAIHEVEGMPAPKSEKERKAAIKAVGEKVSRVLGNEPAQALASYIAPEVFSLWEIPLSGSGPSEQGEARQEKSGLAAVLVGRASMHFKSEFKEEDHPRAADGKFGSGGGGKDGGAPATKKYGPSKANVKAVGPQDAKKAEKAGKDMLGKDFTLAHAASLAGAPDDAEVTVTPEKGGGLHVQIDHPAFAQPCIRRIVPQGKGVPPIMVNEIIDVKESYRGKGLGTDIFARQVEQASEAGVSAIHCHAAKMNDRGEPYFNGYYTWPLLGYNAYMEDIAEESHEGRKVVEKAKQAFPEAECLLDIVSTDEGRKWWKANGCDVHDAKFTLKKGSASMAQLQGYLSAKEARGK